MTFAGEALSRLLPFSVPAGIYGLLLLFLCLAAGVVKLEQVERAGDILLTVLPAGAGRPTLGDELRGLLLPLLAIALISTVAVMVVTGRAAQGLVRRSGRAE